MRKNRSNATSIAELRSKAQVHQTNAIKRLHKDLKDLRNSEIPIYGITASPVKDDMHVWHGNIRAPGKPNLYAGGVFHFEMTFPQNYPVDPPKITIFTNGSTPLPHPCISGNVLTFDVVRKPSGK